MLSIPRPLRTALVGATAAATIGAGFTAFVAAPASAAETTQLRIEAVYPTDRSGSAGTCQIFRIFPTDAVGQTPSDSGIINIRLTENPESDTQDVDFCNPPAAPDGRVGVRPGHAHYTNGQPDPLDASTGTTKEYTPSRSVVSPEAENVTTRDNPDSASGASRLEDPRVSATNTNPSGVDFVDDVAFDTTKPNNTFIEFGVAGLVPGGAFIDAFFDREREGSDEGTRQTSEPQATRMAVTFTAGGPPQSVAANNAVSSINPDQDSYTAVQTPNTPAQIGVTLTNPSDTVFGVTPRYRVQNGPNASNADVLCTESTNFGESRCTFVGARPGTDTVLIYVNRSAASGGVATEGPDAGDAQRTVTVTTYAQPAPAANARFIDLTPNSPTTQEGGTSKVFIATVTDAGGAPVQGAQVTFEETGPGQLQGGTSADGNTSTVTVFSGPDGRAPVTSTTRAGESGTQTVTARISNTTTQCGQVFNGRTGTCSDTTTNTVGGGVGASPSASASASPSASASSSATPSASTTATASSSAVPSGTSSPTRAARDLTLRVTSPSTITPGQGSVLRATGEPNSTVVLRCYSRPSTDYFNARTGSVGTDGSIEFRLNPGTNTRCFVKYTGAGDNDDRNSPSVVQNVATALSLTVIRNGTRDYTFQGRILPRRAGQLITLYRVDNGREVLTKQVKTDATGTWRIRRVFTGSGRFDFIARTGQNLTNVAGRSNVRPTAIF